MTNIERMRRRKDALKKKYPIGTMWDLESDTIKDALTEVLTQLDELKKATEE